MKFLPPNQRTKNTKSKVGKDLGVNHQVDLELLENRVIVETSIDRKKSQELEQEIDQLMEQETGREIDREIKQETDRRIEKEIVRGIETKGVHKFNFSDSLQVVNLNFKHST